MSRSALPFLIGLFALEAAGLATMATTLDVDWEPPAPVKASVDVGALERPPMPVATADENSDFVRRPLFWESRRPIPVAAPTPAVTEDIFADLQVVGIFGSGEGGGAIVRHKGLVKRLGLGREFEGWRLERVEGTKLVFSTGSAQHVVLLKHAEQARAPVPPPVPPLGGAPGQGAAPPVAAAGGEPKPPAASASSAAGAGAARPGREERNAQLSERRRQIREKMGL